MLQTQIISSETYFAGQKLSFRWIECIRQQLETINSLQTDPIYSARWIAELSHELCENLADMPETSWSILWEQKSPHLIDLLKWRFKQNGMDNLVWCEDEHRLLIDGPEDYEGRIITRNSDGSFSLEITNADEIEEDGYEVEYDDAGQPLYLDGVLVTRYYSYTWLDLKIETKYRGTFLKCFNALSSLKKGALQ